MIRITKKIAQKCLDIIDCGLSEGMGDPVPGKMCVEAAVCYAMGLPHGDEPKCVDPALRSLKIKINDIGEWGSNKARAAGLRRLGVAQLGSAGKLNTVKFVTEVIGLTITTVLKAYSRNSMYQPWKEWANSWLIGKDRTGESACRMNWQDGPLGSVAFAAYELERYDSKCLVAESCGNAIIQLAAEVKQPVKLLKRYCEDVVQILVKMKAPGCRWLRMTEAA